MVYEMCPDSAMGKLECFASVLFLTGRGLPLGTFPALVFLSALQENGQVPVVPEKVPGREVEMWELGMGRCLCGGDTITAEQGPQRWTKGIRAVHEEHLLWVSTASMDSQMDMRVDRHMDGHVEVGELSLTGEERSWSLG